MDDRWDDIDDDDNESEESTIDWGGRDGVIYLIDFTKEMFETQDEDCFFKTAIKCCHTMMLNKIASSSTDLIGVVLLGTDKSENHLSVSHICVLQELEQPNIKKIKSLETILNSDTFDNIETKYGHSNDYLLADALWLCQSIFANCTKKMASQRILLFTCNDHPHANSRLNQQRAMQRADDLQKLDISLDLLQLGPTFDVGNFYKDLVEAAMGEEYAEWSLTNSQQNLQEIMLRVCRYNHKKRTQTRCLLHLGPNAAIGIGIYSMMRKRPVPKKVWLERDTNKEVKSQTHRFESMSCEKVMPMNYIKYKEYGGKKIIFTPQEVKEIKSILPYGFHLMGFKDTSAIKLQYHYRKPVFIFPDETQVKGSRKLFAALLERCAAKDKVMLCWGTLRKGTAPHLFVLFPTLEVINEETGNQEQPGGFHAFVLPTSDMIRKFDLPKMEDASQEQLDAMKQIVNKLTADYKVHNFRHPVLQKQWAAIEALALERSSVREVPDDTVPLYKVMKRKLGDLSEGFNDIFYPDGFDPNVIKKGGKAPAKRPASRDGGETSRSSKVKKNDEDMDVEEMARLNKLEKLKVNDLKDYLTAKGRKVLGKKKAELIDMVYEVVGN